MRNFVKIVFLSVMCAFFPLAALSAESAFDAFPPAVSGDYAIYRDYTWKEPTWVGLLRYDDTTWGAVCVTPSTKSNVSVLFRAEIADGKLVLTGQSIISKITQNDVTAVNYLMRLLPDLYSWRHDADASAAVPSGASSRIVQAAASRSAILPAPVYSAKKLASFGGDVILSWLPEVPALGFAGMTGADGKPVLELARAGRIRSGGDQEFFGFTPLPEGKTGETLFLSVKRTIDAKTVDGVTLKLDGQWKQVADNTFFLGNSAVIIVDTIDLAAAGITAKELPLSLVRLFSLSSGSSWAMPGEFSVTGDEKKFRVMNLFHDTETNIRNRDVKLCVPSADGKTATIVSLSAHESVWRANREYFDSLF
jgi:hypothetical protein